MGWTTVNRFLAPTGMQLAEAAIGGDTYWIYRIANDDDEDEVRYVLARDDDELGEKIANGDFYDYDG